MSGGINKSAGMQNLREGRLNWCLGEGCCRESENNGGSFLYPSPRPSLSTSNLAAQSDTLKASVCPIGQNMGSLLLSKAIALNPLSALVIQSSSTQKKKCRREIVDFPSLNRCFVKGPNLWQNGCNDFQIHSGLFHQYSFSSHTNGYQFKQKVEKVSPNRKNSA